MVEYHPNSAKDQSKLRQFGAKVSSGIFLGYALYVEESGKGDIVVADIEESEEMDAPELHARRLNAKEVSTPPEPGIVQNEEKNKKFFKENQMNYNLQPHFKKTQRWMMRKLKVTSGQ